MTDSSTPKTYVPGMKVLDVGSGAGDVAFTAADIVVDQQTLDAGTLAARFRADVARTRFPSLMLPLVTDWARKP
ncbi:MAG: hypothetical protein ACYDCC_05220 [Actinomycetota bacterium]